MLKNFTWNMTGYIPKYPVDPSVDGIRPYIAERIFQLEPEPPKVSNPNEYILSALQKKNLLYFSFFLHHYEPQLNKRIKSFLGVENGEGYNTDHFVDIKLDCREMILQKLTDYDPSRVQSLPPTSIHSFEMQYSVSVWAKKNGRYPL